MRISFSLPSTSSKLNPIKPSTDQNDDASIQCIHEFTAAEQPPPPGPRVIPPISNEWQPGKAAVTNLESVADSLSLDSEIPYNSEESVLHKLREDLKALPESSGAEEFDQNPVEGFGAALLAGYGWQPGRGIGKNAREDVGVKEVRSNVGRRGLGFRPE